MITMITVFNILGIFQSFRSLHFIEHQKEQIIPFNEQNNCFDVDIQIDWNSAYRFWVGVCGFCRGFDLC